MQGFDRPLGERPERPLRDTSWDLEAGRSKPPTMPPDSRYVMTTHRDKNYLPGSSMYLMISPVTAYAGVIEDVEVYRH